MAAALAEAGFDTRCYTSFPGNRFGSIRGAVHSFVWPEVVFRVASKAGLENWGDLLKMQIFGRWLSRRLKRRPPQVLIAWSSFALEAFSHLPQSIKILVRDSTHISFQYSVLSKEYERQGIKFPNRNFCLKRELQEYQMADQIWVCSELAKKTFVDANCPESKLRVLHLGVDTARFRPGTPSPAKLPLKAVYFGALSFRKGVHYLLEATAEYPRGEGKLFLVGDVEPAFRRVLKRYSHFKPHPAMPQSRLAKFIAGMDIAVLPSIEDGFGQVVPQAMACGLVCLVSNHCGASELIDHGRNGFVFEACNALAIRDCLDSLISNPELIDRLRETILDRNWESGWSQYSQEVCRYVTDIYDSGY